MFCYTVLYFFVKCLIYSVYCMLGFVYVIAVPATGICVGDPIRLVMEIAKLGPLNKFLRKKL